MFTLSNTGSVRCYHRANKCRSNVLTSWHPTRRHLCFYIVYINPMNLLPTWSLRMVQITWVCGAMLTCDNNMFNCFPELDHMTHRQISNLLLHHYTKYTIHVYTIYQNKTWTGLYTPLCVWQDLQDCVSQTFSSLYMSEGQMELS